MFRVPMSATLCITVRWVQCCNVVPRGASGDHIHHGADFELPRWLVFWSLAGDPLKLCADFACYHFSSGLLDIHAGSHCSNGISCVNSGYVFCAFVLDDCSVLQVRLNDIIGTSASEPIGVFGVWAGIFVLARW